MKDKIRIVLLGYQQESGNTCWYPWNMFANVFKELGFDTIWADYRNLSKEIIGNKRNVFIVWNEPDALTVIEQDFYTKQKDIIIQKVVGGSPRFNTPSYGKTIEEAEQFFYKHNYPDYKMCLDLLNDGHDIHVFGARTSNENTPIKKEICQLLGERMNMIPWGSCLYTKEELQKVNPITDNFTYDIGYVGSIWGTSQRGNIQNINNFLLPVFESTDEEKVKIVGRGTIENFVSNARHKEILKASKLCPIINSDSWKALKGVQDRFWTVFSSGRFGVADTEGVYEFYNEDEVVVATDKEEYIDKSIYYLNNIDKQTPYIQKCLERIKKEYNLYITWEIIMKKVLV
jgi:hypothetical protein